MDCDTLCIGMRAATYYQDFPDYVACMPILMTKMLTLYINVHVFY